MDIKVLADHTWTAFWRDSKSAETHRGRMKQVVRSFRASPTGDAKYRYDQPIDQITTEQIEGVIETWIAEGKSKPTVNRLLSCLSRMLTYAHRRGWLATVPFIPRYREAPPRLRYASPAEEARLVDLLIAAGHRDYAALVMFLVDTGARVGEVLKLRWEDVVEHEDGNVSVVFRDTKNNTSRCVPLTGKARFQVLEARELRPKWAGPFSRMMYDHFLYAWNQCRAVMGLSDDQGFTPHCLRHATASRLLQRHVDVFRIKELLGHKSLETTMRYAHLDSTSLREAISTLEDPVD